MKKPSDEEIPRSIIKGNGVIRADLNFTQSKGDLLFLSPKCIVVGLDSLPYMLFATPEFSFDILPVHIKNNIHLIREIVFQSTFSVEINRLGEYSYLPNWLEEVQGLEHLHLKYIIIDDLILLKDLSIQHLILDNVKYNDKVKLIQSIGLFKYLKEVSCDKSVDAELIESIKKLNLKFTLYSEEQS
ncbi:hypothetical protein [Pedobacter frigoris]|uniref:hypothetical protein n=1 Tax=Pedobacter frigoris TaxID=2571272 RepID=UPI00292E0E75|nr:hypothetical protein [Pedobacter frigoris]